MIWAPKMLRNCWASVVLFRWHVSWQASESVAKASRSGLFICDVQNDSVAVRVKHAETPRQHPNSGAPRLGCLGGIYSCV